SADVVRAVARYLAGREARAPVAGAVDGAGPGDAGPGHADVATALDSRTGYRDTRSGLERVDEIIGCNGPDPRRRRPRGVEHHAKAGTHRALVARRIDNPRGIVVAALRVGQVVREAPVRAAYRSVARGHAVAEHLQDFAGRETARDGALDRRGIVVGQAAVRDDTGSLGDVVHHAGDRDDLRRWRYVDHEGIARSDDTQVA